MKVYCLVKSMMNKDEKSAEERMRSIAKARNNLEYELKNY